VSSSILGVSANPYLVLFLAALPDIDLLLGILGIEHRTWTHSVLLWSIAFAPFFVKYRKHTIPYFVAPIQHIILGDAIVGSWNTPFWPLSFFNLTLGHGLLSMENIALEAAGLAIFLLLVLATREGRLTFFGKNKRKVLGILALLPLIGFVFFVYLYDELVDVLVDNHVLMAGELLDSTPTVTKHQLFPYVLAMHLILISVLVSSLFGFKIRARLTTLHGKS
jgi:hypothetical protein